MVAINSLVRNRREVFVAELTEAALEAASRHGVRGASVELEINLWKSLEATLERLAMSGGELGWDHRVAVLVRAAYGVALSHGIRGSFVELELELWRRLRNIVRHDRFLPRATPSRAPHGMERLSTFLAIR